MTDNMAYVAYCAECGGMVAASVDLPEYRKHVAKEVAQRVREGSRVERVTCQYVRDNLRGCTAECACKWCRKRAKAAALKASAKVVAQSELLVGAPTQEGE